MNSPHLELLFLLLIYLLLFYPLLLFYLPLLFYLLLLFYPFTFILALYTLLFLLFFLLLSMAGSQSSSASEVPLQVFSAPEEAFSPIHDAESIHNCIS